MLRLNNVQFKYGKKKILNGITLQFNKGKVYGIIGPNGAGKSTLLNLIAKDIKPTGGEILLKDQDVSSYNHKNFARMLSYMRQNIQVRFSYTVSEFISMGRYCYDDCSASENKRIVDYRIQEMDLSNYQNTPLTELSGGEVQRAFFAKTLVQDGQIILVDEGVSNADIFYKLRFFDILKKEAALGKLVIVIMHDLFLAKRYCDQLVVLNQQQIYAQDSSEKVLNRQMLDTVFKVKGDVVNNTLILD